MSEPALPIDATTSDPTAAAVPSARSFLGHAKIIGALTFVSRILGLAREIVFAHYFGTGLVATAFNVAFSIPNLFRKLFGEGALSAAFIPLYAQSVKNESLKEVNDFAAAGVNLLCAILLVITVVGEAILLGILMLDHDMRIERVLLLKFTMIMLPYVLLICGGAFLSGILQVHHRFAAPAFAPVLLNVCHIGIVFFGAMFLGLRAVAHVGAHDIALQTKLAYWLAFVVLVAGVLQVAILLPGLRAVGFEFKIVRHFWTAPVKRMLTLTVPVALGAGVLQLSVFLDKGISLIFMRGVDTQTGAPITHFNLLGHLIRLPMELGAPVRLSAAQLMYQFPLGIFAIALATAIFPQLSSEAGGSDPKRFARVLRQGIEASLWEGFPASIGLMLVAVPAVRLLFQHGEITAHDASLISRSLQFYAVAIWAFSLQQIISRAYYALHDTKTPLVMSIVTLAVNLAVEIPLLWTPLAESGMALGTAASFTVQALVMLWMLDRRVGGLELAHSVKPILKMLAATAIMTGACLIVMHLPLYPHGATRGAAAMQLAIVTIVGAAVYLVACSVMKIDMIKSLRKH